MACVVCASQTEAAPETLCLFDPIEELGAGQWVAEAVDLAHDLGYTSLHRFDRTDVQAIGEMNAKQPRLDGAKGLGSLPADPFGSRQGDARVRQPRRPLGCEARCRRSPFDAQVH